jgi:hypothetical protein
LAIAAIRNDVSEFDIGFVRLDTKQKDLPALRRGQFGGLSQALDEKILVADVMVGRQQDDDGVWITRQDMQKGEEHAVRRAAILRLLYDVVVEEASQLRVAPHAVLRGHNCADAVRRRESERPLQASLNQGRTSLQ